MTALVKTFLRWRRRPSDLAGVDHVLHVSPLPSLLFPLLFFFPPFLEDMVDGRAKGKTVRTVAREEGLLTRAGIVSLPLALFFFLFPPEQAHSSAEVRSVSRFADKS